MLFIGGIMLLIDILKITTNREPSYEIFSSAFLISPQTDSICDQTLSVTSPTTYLEGLSEAFGDVSEAAPTLRDFSTWLRFTTEREP
jgi:hypothetical protein